MSLTELKRAEVLGRVKAGALTLRAASALMGLSYRQTRRVWKRFRKQGPLGLRHRSVGRRSGRRKPAAFRRQVLRLVRREFGGDATHVRFGPTLAAEHLAEEYDVVVHHETLRRWMLAEGHWSRVRRASPHRQRRERKAHFGELVQLDGSFHAWLEDRGPTACLMDLVDDATGTVLLRFEPEETIWGAVRSLRAWIAAYGIPLALYTDWKNVYVRKPTDAEIAAGDAAFTPFGWMCATLGIRIIAASSPQAKGRVERTHGTHQDRLVKKLRRAGIADYDGANAFLTSTYVPGHNARFARAAAAAEDYHTPVPRSLDLDQVFRIATARTVGRDWVVRYDNRLLQLQRHGHRDPPAGSRVEVCEYEDGHLEVWYGDTRLPWTAITARAPAPPPLSRAVAGRARTPAPNHPWRRRAVPERRLDGPRQRQPVVAVTASPPGRLRGPAVGVGVLLGGLDVIAEEGTF